MSVELLTPSTSEAEAGIVAAVMATNGRDLDDLALRGDDFADKRVGDFFDLMRDRYARGLPVDQISMLDTDHKLDRIAIGSLEPVVSSTGYLAEIVAKHGLARRLQSVGAALAAFGTEKFDTAELMIARAQSLVDDAVGRRSTRVRFVADILPDVITSMEDSTSYVPTPWMNLNHLIGGLRPGAVYVVGARPGVGKSVIALQLAQALAGEGAVAFSSLEMSEEEIVKRMLSERLSIPMHRTSNNAMTQDDWKKLAEHRKRIERRIAIDSRASVGPLEIKQHARQVARLQPLAGVVVDYLQLMSSAERKQSRYEAVTDFSRQMKLLAKDLHVPVVLLSQLNRNSTSGMDSTPRLSELRDSGAIEQDADVVLLLHRDTVQDSASAGVIEVNVAKNRHGQTGVFELAWQGHFARAVDMGAL